MPWLAALQGLRCTAVDRLHMKLRTFALTLEAAKLPNATSVNNKPITTSLYAAAGMNVQAVNKRLAVIT
jgi:hypothetical protein